MRHYLDYYFDIYWDLHLGVKGDAIPAEVRQIGESFNTVLAYREPDAADRLRKLHEGARAARLPEGVDRREARGSSRTDARRSRQDHRLVLAQECRRMESISAKKDIVFECFHNFVALSQWGNTIFGIMSRLSKDGGDAEVRASFKKTMSGDYDNANGAPYTPLELFVMELFRTISPNGGSISAIEDARRSFYGRSPHAVVDANSSDTATSNTPHTSTSFDPRHWINPQQFDPDRYKTCRRATRSTRPNASRSALPGAPSTSRASRSADGRKAGLTNSGFGTVFGVVDGKPLPVCDYAGFAPFGFGYRRCPGEQLTIQVFEDFLRKVWRTRSSS